MSKQHMNKNTLFNRLMQYKNARFGLSWIFFMATLAVFAPFIANSHPYLITPKSVDGVKGETFYPLFSYLDYVDVLLLILYVVAIIAFYTRAIHAQAKFLYLLILLVMGYVLGFSHDYFDQDSFWPTIIGVSGTVIAVLLSTKLHSIFTDELNEVNRCGKHLHMIFFIGFTGILFTSVGMIPSKTVEYDQYRAAIEAGEYENWVYAPIHYSPKDYQQDYGKRQEVLRKAKGIKEKVGGEKGAANQKPFAIEGCYIGTESNGGDLLSRMIYATRIALSIGFISTTIALSIGVSIGGVMGYYSGIVDIIGMRMVEIAEAIPSLVLMIIFVAFFGSNIYMMMVIIGFTSWSGYARYTRAEFLKLRKLDFIHAAKASGLPLGSIIFKHMLPNGVAPVLVQASFGVAAAILIEATLSFLGLGVVDDPSWGEMLKQSSDEFHWWMAVFPGLAIFMTVFSYNLIGEALRDAIDPHSKRMSQL